MAESVTFNNAVYIIPDVGESNWGQNLTNYFVAIPQGCYQLSGGTAPLTADLSFGTNFGIFAKYFTSVSANPATVGNIRLANADSVEWRNASNNGNFGLGPNGADQLAWGGSSIISNYFASLNPPTAIATAGVVRLANTETIQWRNNANSANLILSADTSGNLLWNGSIVSVAGSTDTFAKIFLTNTTNQIVLGTTNTVTISSTAPSASRVYTLPDAGGSANIMLDAGNYTVTGTWTSVTLVTPALGTPASGVLTNCTGTASGLTAGHVTTNANLTGPITSSGNSTSIAAQTGTGSTFVVQTSPSLTTPNIGAATATSLTFSPTTNGIVGTTTNNNVAAGSVGEYVSNSAAVNAVSLSSAMPANVTSISLTAGDWDVSGIVVLSPSGTTTYAQIYAGTSTTTATLPGTNLLAGWAGSTQIPPALIGTTVATQRYSLASTTTVYLVVQCSFGTSTMTAGGFMAARRMR